MRAPDSGVLECLVRLLCIYGQGVPELDMPHLQTLSTKLKWMLLSEIPDNMSANVRKQDATTDRLPANALYAREGCAEHKLHRTVITSWP